MKQIDSMIRIIINIYLFYLQNAKYTYYIYPQYVTQAYVIICII